MQKPSSKNYTVLAVLNKAKIFELCLKLSKKHVITAYIIWHTGYL